jgi:hypothetical protein
MALASTAGVLHLALALRKTRPVGVAEAIEAVAAAHPRHVAGQLAIGG